MTQRYKSQMVQRPDTVSRLRDLVLNRPENQPTLENDHYNPHCFNQNISGFILGKRENLYGRTSTVS